MEKLLINTPQNVRIEYPLASVGTRFLALVIDIVLMAAYGYLVFYLLTELNVKSYGRFFFFGFLSFFLLPILLYHFILESFLSGQTIGKKALKVKVVRIDGSRATIYEYFIRWILNLVDIWMMSGVVGLLSIVLSEKSQRIGDLAAGTTVVSLKPRIALNQTVFENLANTYQPVFPEYKIAKLSDHDVNIIKQSLKTAHDSNDYELLERLAEKISSVTGILEGEIGGWKFVDTVLKDHYHYFNGE